MDPDTSTVRIRVCERRSNVSGSMVEDMPTCIQPAVRSSSVVTNGGARDTDELIKQRCPVYSRYISRRFNPGRLEYAGHGMPVNCGGVLVRPGDMVVADGDGVIVVPVEKALQVAEIARGILDGDKRGRRHLYDQAGIPPDDTVI